MAARPQRLQLSRRTGFDLQAVSLALNGLPARRVTRPGPWGNPFSIVEIAERHGLDASAGAGEGCGALRGLADRPARSGPVPGPAAEP